MKLSVSHLGFSYGAHAVLKDISFSLDSGEFLSVLGPNGVGKTTLFRCILGILSAYSGQIALDGEDTKKLSPRNMAAKIAYIPQIHRPAFGYTVQDTVLMGVTHRISPFYGPSSKDILLAREAMARMGIADLAERNFGSLSGGEQQLVLVARALVQQSRILVMDEPTSALDYGNQFRVLQRVRNLTKEGYAVLLSTHNPQHALRFSQRILALFDGQVAAYGDSSTELTPTLIRQLYGVYVEFVETPRGRVLLPYKDESEESTPR